MEDINEIILKRKYFFSQPVKNLFEALIYREVPEIPSCHASCDHINQLYQQYDNANNLNRNFEYHEQRTLATITKVKEPHRRYNSPRNSSYRNRTARICNIIIWQYINRNVIVRIREEFKVDDINFHFRYMHFDSIYSYLEFEKNRGTAIKENQFLAGISDEYNFDLWFLNKLMPRGALNNV